MLPGTLLRRLPQGALVVEVGVGGRGGALSWLAENRGDLRLRATDVRARALEGLPATVETARDDVFEPDQDLYRGASLVYAIRCPEELQVPLARLAARIDAALGLVVLKDELADLAGILGAPELVRDGTGRTWRIWWGPLT